MDHRFGAAGTSGIGPLLLGRARAAIARELGYQSTAAPDGPALDLQGATFVTLTRDGQLRGCIGSLEARRPLREDVDKNALAAAFGDPRFPPLSREEFAELNIEVSVLSAPEPMSFRDEADALAQLRPGIDGVILSAGFKRATFLPQVWDSLPNPHQFITHLKRKAGLADDYWSPDVALARYQALKFKESPDG